ncbi:MAG: chromosome segregation protein SMC [Nanoarchaeota archaeon]|nr:chromosome segregation protein SMC [Nanoarchaeota archaeon]
MTRINKIVIKGFKSFAKRTELLFGNNFNCVLGPNGSGKSNIMDAICFVLGRVSSKSLRAEKSANLIYNGGKKGIPAKSGEVSIYFDNSRKIFPSDDSEIKVTRIVKQTGASVYKINDKKRTRQQVLDMMSVAAIDPEGYNIILQGDIDKFVEMSLNERRLIIEEIAGISIYEDKKKKALNELDKVENKLNEADIILTERQTYLKELKSERDQALKYKKMSDNIKQNKATYLNIQITKKENEQKKFESEIKACSDKIKDVQDKINNLKKTVAEKKDKINKITEEIEEKGEKEQLDMQKNVEQLRVNIETNKTRIATCENELVKIDSRKDQLQKDLTEVHEKIDSLISEISKLEKIKKGKNDDISELEDSIKNFKKKHKVDNLDEIEKEIEEVEKQEEDGQREIQILREKQQELLREKDRIEYQIQNIDAAMQKVLDVEKESKEDIENLKEKKNDFKKKTLELNKLLNEDSSLAAQLSKSKDNLLSAKGELERLKVKNIGIKEKASANIAVKSILEQKQNIKGIHGTVAELGHVSAKYSLALEVAAGSRIQSIIVEDDKVAETCIKYLKNNKLGVANFLPLNKIKGATPDNEVKKALSSNGVHNLAIELVSFDSKFKKAFSYVFGKTIVVDNISVARRLGIGSYRMVTLEGDLIETSGSMRGGYRKKSRVSFQQEDFTKDFQECEKKVNELQEVFDILHRRRSEVEENIIKLRNEKSSLEGEIIKLEKTLHLETGDTEASKKQRNNLKENLKEIDKQIADTEKSIEENNKKLASIKIKKQELRIKISGLRNPTLLAELNTFEDKKQEIKNEILEIDSKISSINMQINDILKRDEENIIRILKEQEKEKKDFSAELEQIKEKIEKQKEELVKKEKNQKEFRTKFKELFKKRDLINSEILKAENEIMNKEDQNRGTETRMNNISMKNVEVKAEFTGLKKEFEQYEDVELLKEKSEESLQREINRFEALIGEFGAVNMRALEVYDNIEKEYKKLLEKKEMLAAEKKDVIAMIDEVENKKKELFMVTFNAVNGNFKNIFSKLTSKGIASIVLENEKEPFEGGLRIKVKITGKKFMDIHSLSGGEKSLTALAFIFAIQDYKPALFYVLDEVDAALDKHNSEKLAKLIRKYSEKAQYIVISHNDAIITEADTLYGVSMGVNGVSSVVSLKI